VVDSVVLWRRLVGAQVRSQLQYRTSFVLDACSAFLISFIDFLAVLVIFHNTQRLGAWSIREVAFLYAMSSISFALTDLLVGHFDQFPQKIRDGNFDIMLVRPRGTLFQVIGSDFQLRRVGKALQGVLVLVYAVGSLTIPWDAGRIAMLVVMIPAAIVIFGSVWTIGSCLSFWTTDGGEFTNAGGISLNYVAVWDGTNWSALGPGMNNSVYALALDSAHNLYAGGAFTTAGGAPVAAAETLVCNDSATQAREVRI